MSFLTPFEHDAFVSYAHSGLDAWSKGFVEDLRQLVAGGLSPEARQALDFWIDTKTEGNFPLTENLKRKVERSACMIVLMTERFLESNWCTSEIKWFNETVAHKTKDLSQPVFIVRLDDIRRTQWPESLRALDLPGYDFSDDLKLKLPKGYSGPNEKPYGEAYQHALRSVARDMVDHIKMLKERDVEQIPPSSVCGERKTSTDQHAKGAEMSVLKRRLYLAAVPEDSLKLRRDIAARLSPHFEIVPAENPRDPKIIKEQAAGWIGSCEICAAVLGSSSGIWNEDDDGFVLYQQGLFQKGRKQTFNYRSPKLGDIADLDPGPYRNFIEQLQLAPGVDPAEFARTIIEAQAPEERSDTTVASVYLVTDGDRALEKDVRDLLWRLGAMAFPLPLAAPTSRDLAELNSDDAIKDFIKISNAVLLLNGEGKTADRIAIHRKAGTIGVRFAPALGRQRAIAIVDGPPDPRLENLPPFLIFRREAPDFSAQLKGWLAMVAPSAVGAAQ